MARIGRALASIRPAALIGGFCERSRGHCQPNFLRASFRVRLAAHSSDCPATPAQSWPPRLPLPPTFLAYIRRDSALSISVVFTVQPFVSVFLIPRTSRISSIVFTLRKLACWVRPTEKTQRFRPALGASGRVPWQVAAGCRVAPGRGRGQYLRVGAPSPSILFPRVTRPARRGDEVGVVVRAAPPLRDDVVGGVGCAAAVGADSAIPGDDACRGPLPLAAIPVGSGTGSPGAMVSAS